MIALVLTLCNGAAGQAPQPSLPGIAASPLPSKMPSNAPLPRGALARLLGGSNPFLTLAYSPDGKWLASGGYEKTIQIWDAESGKELRRWQAPEGNIIGLVFAPDGRLLASGGVYDQRVHLWDPQHGQELRSLEELPRGSSSLAFSPDGKTLAAGGYHTHDIFLWHTATGKLIRRLSGPLVRGAELENPSLPDYSYVAFAPDGKTLASGHLHGLIRIWDVAALRELRHFRGPSSDVFVHLCFSPDGQMLACWGSTIRLWRTATWKELRYFGEQDELRVCCLALSPDGRMLASGSAGRDLGDDTVHLWDTATGEERCRLAGHEYAVSAVCFSPDGTRLVSGSRDGTALVWDLNNPPLAEPIQAGLSAQALDRFWNDCASTEGPRAFRAVLTLVHNPQAALSLLRDRLHPVILHSPQRLEQFIAALDSGRFKDRQEAADELALQAQLIEPALRAALKKQPSAEARRRLEQILKTHAEHHFSPRQLQMLRGVEALERIGTHEAAKLLEAVSSGTAEFQITREAKSARERLQKRSPPRQ